jgi:hypothetical protein
MLKRCVTLVFFFRRVPDCTATAFPGRTSGDNENERARENCRAGRERD